MFVKSLTTGTRRQDAKGGLPSIANDDAAPPPGAGVMADPGAVVAWLAW